MPPKAPCKNYQFLKWLEEMRDEAEEKGSKSFSTYKKACANLRVFPRTEAHPASLAECQGIGPGIIKRLQAKLEAYNEQHGIAPVPLSPESLAMSGKRRRDPGQNESPNKKSKAPSRVVDSDEDGDVVPPRALEKQKKAAARAKRKEPKEAGGRGGGGGKKMYVPAVGTGAYAILLAMRQEAPNGEKMSKDEIIEAAEAGGWCNGPFVKKGISEGFYTAWNGMKTLNGNGLVGTHGRPAKFWLSDTGIELAEALFQELPVDPYEQDRRDRVASASARASGSQGSSQPSGSQPSGPRLSASAMLSAALGREEQSAGRRVALDGVGRVGGSRPAAPVAREPEKFGYFFVNRAGAQITVRDEARMKLGHEDDEVDTTFVKIEFRTSQAGMPFVRATVVGVETAPEGRSGAGPTSFGWVVYDDVSPSAPGFPNVPLPPAPSQHRAASAPGLASPFQGAGPSRSQPPASSSPAPGLGGGARAVNVAHESRLVPKGMPRTLSAPSSMTGPGMSNLLATIVNSRASQAPVPSGSGYAAYSTSSNSNAVAGPSNPKPPAPAPSAKARPSALVKNPSRRLSAQKTNSSVFALDENAHYAHQEDDDVVPVAPRSSHKAFTPIAWEAGSYDITMVLDNREIKSKSNRTGFLDALRKDGMEVEQRALPLGDVLWVAKRKDGGGIDTNEEECVLSWVIERKRLDDLVTSIQDGRFHEQKYRMQNSGMEQVIYLIEDYAIQQDVWAASVATAVSSTQVIDGFFVKRTNSFEDSISYLKGMHDTIKTVLEYETLYVIPNAAISRTSYLPLQTHLRATQPSNPYKTSYKAYCDLNSKSASVTIGEVWGQMLLTISGLSPEKVSAILEVYKTPRSLWKAYKEADEEEERAVRKAGGEEGMEKKWKRGDRGRTLLERTVKAEPGSRRAIGKALSIKVYELFRKEAY